MKTKLLYFLLGFVAIVSVTSIAFGETITLRTGFQDSFPKFWFENGRHEGVCTDIIRAIEKESQGEIKFVYPDHYFPWKRLLAMLKHDELDIVFGMVKTEERKKSFRFVNYPIYSLKHIIAVRKDDDVVVNNFEDIAKLGNDGIVLTTAGTAIPEYIRRHNKDIIVEAATDSIYLCLKKLMAKRGRFVYYHDLGLKTTIRKEGLGDFVRVLPHIFREYHQYAALSNRVAAHVAVRLENILRALDEKGILSDIYKKHTDF